MIIAKEGHMPSLFPSAEGKRYRRYSGSPLEAKTPYLRVREMAAFGGRGTAGRARARGTKWFPCPLLTPPNPPLR